MAQRRQITSAAPYPYIPIRVQIRRWESEALALLDTGFTGELVIPESVLFHLGIPDDHTDVEVADNRIIPAPAFLGAIEIIGLDPIPDVHITVLGDEYILGLGILDLYKVTFDHGERVIIEP